MSRRGQIKNDADGLKKPLAKLVKQVADTGFELWEVWSDMTYFFAAAISNSIQMQYSQKREDEYMQRMEKYRAIGTKATDLFPSMFAEITRSLEKGGGEGCREILGEIFMELELASHWKEQFFTPWAVCQAMVGVTTSKEKIEAGIAERGFVTVNDPACGAGALLIAHADFCRQNGINYQYNCLYYAQDLDPVAARMCYVQMSLLGMPGIVTIGDTLAKECRDVWYTPFYWLHGFNFRKQRERAETELAAPAPVDMPLFELEGA